MNIRIPSAVMRASDWFVDWVNVEIVRRGRIEVRRIDLLLVVLFFVCTAWYWHASGWMGALQGGAMYAALAALALWVF